MGRSSPPSRIVHGERREAHGLRRRISVVVAVPEVSALLNLLPRKSVSCRHLHRMQSPHADVVVGQVEATAATIAPFRAFAHIVVHTGCFTRFEAPWRPLTSQIATRK